MSGKGDWNPKGKYRAYLDKLSSILQNGEQRTVRDCYYALEARGFPDELKRKSYDFQLQKHEDDPETHPHPDTMPTSDWLWEFEYRYVKRAVKKGRRAGYISPQQIIDASRRAENKSLNGWSSPESFINNRVDGIWNKYWEDFWDDQDTYLEIWLEKQSLASVFAPICEDYNIRLEATRGDWSDSKVYEACQRLISKINDGKDVRILYFGDYNPSGFHAPVSILDAMGYYGIELGRSFPKSDDRRYYDAEHRLPSPFPSGGSFSIERLALTTEQIERFDLPENPNPSSTDKDKKIKRHFQNFVSNGRDTNVELNALKEYEREFLEELVEESILDHIDEAQKEETEQRAEDAKTRLAECIDIDRSKL